MKMVDDAVQAASSWNQLGKPEQALRAFEELGKLRAIEEIPLPRLIASYSALNGKLGNYDKQMALRGLLFGINQVIAHSGDGLSPETAVHVIAIEEEYGWLLDRGLTRQSQSIVDNAIGKFDLLVATDSSGTSNNYYFNITSMYARNAAGLNAATK